MSLDWTTLTDGELATLSIAGREAAFAEIMRRHRQSIFRMVRACVGEADEALDLLQETFVAAHQALPRYDGDRSMRAWLSTIAINKCRDWGRKRTVRRPGGNEQRASTPGCKHTAASDEREHLAAGCNHGRHSIGTMSNHISKGPPLDKYDIALDCS